VIQATMGSFLRVDVRYTDLNPFLEKAAQSYPVFGAFLEGENMFEVMAPKEGILVIGNESKGISDEIARFVTQKVKIPGGRQNGVTDSAESLNASVAAGIMMAWFSKK
jgi:RNA methyltransferase, TrmH family